MLKLDVEVRKVCDWILDQIDANIDKKDYGPIEVYLLNNHYELRTGYSKKETYDLRLILKKFDIGPFFTRLQEIIEQEEGFEATLSINLWENLCDTKVVDIKIFIK